MVNETDGMTELEREVLDVVLELGRAAGDVIDMAAAFDEDHVRRSASVAVAAMIRERRAMKALFEVTMTYQAITDGALDRLVGP